MPRMTRTILLILFLAFAALAIPARPLPARESPQETAIRGVLDLQVAAWNRGDVATFMTSYWKSDQTEFIGVNGIVRGWQAVLDRYRRTYPDRKTMGHVAFSGLEVHLTCKDAAFVVGQYHLQRATGNLNGVFTLEFRKFPEGWRIVADHTTAFAAPPASKIP